MLGKTNLTTLSESAIVTEIEDYRWVQIQSGVFGNFVKTIYKNGYLAAITADGTIMYTTDGEVWQIHTLEYKNCKLKDIDWDGSRFILAGSYSGMVTTTDGTSEEMQKGLLIVTSDFELFEKKEFDSKNRYVSEYVLAYSVNGKYIILGSNISTSAERTYICIGDLEGGWEEEKSSGSRTISFAKNSKDIIELYHVSGSSKYGIRRIAGDTMSVNEYERIQIEKNSKAFECKDELYVMAFNGTYSLYKITNSDECMLLSSEKNFAFVDGVYFNECQIFINSHKMLIVKKGESIAEKTPDNLIEIAPELTMNCITKAFGQLYIFGNQGVILKSSVETNNEEAIAVQTLSAKKALLDAKKYTDEKYAILEARIIALESGGLEENE